jgi:universal stress protein E
MMPSIRRILVAVRAIDANSLPTVLKAAQIARACRAQVEIFHCLDSSVYPDLEGIGEHNLLELERILQQRVVQRLEDIATRVRRHNIKVNVRAEWDFPVYEAIVRRAVRIKADLIIASVRPGRHRLPSLMRLTDWELVRLSPVAVLLVKDPHPYRHPAVLAAVDPTHAFAKPSGLDKQILQLGRALSQKLRGSLHAVHAYARVPGGSFPKGAITPALIEQVQQDAERAARIMFDRILKSSPITRAHRYLIARDPVNAIAEAARNSCCAIAVLGGISRSGLKSLLIGNTAERILDDLRCDVLVVKPVHFRNAVPRAVRGVRLLASPLTGSRGYPLLPVR